jgi:hypothetical protein
MCWHPCYRSSHDSKIVKSITQLNIAFQLSHKSKTAVKLAPGEGLPTSSGGSDTTIFNDWRPPNGSGRLGK